MSLSAEQQSQIADAILAGNKIQAIKLYREATGLGLAEAKTEVERLSAGLEGQHPGTVKKQAGGCAAVIVLGFVLAGSLAAALTAVLAAQSAG